MRTIFKCLFLSLLIFSSCREIELPYISLDTDVLTFEYEGGSEMITVSSNDEWAVSGATDWCEVSPKIGNGDLTVTITVTENESLDERKTILIFTCITETVEVEVSQVSKFEEVENGEWVLINGVCWAIRNIGVPGAFVENPEDYGDYYQWNSGTTDFLFWEDYSNSSYSKSTSWLPTNDPSPEGYRVPTLAEIESLCNTTYVSNEWTSINGVYGRKFTDKESGKSIFLPAAGSRDRYVGTLFSVGSDGYYWSSTQDEDFAYILSFNSSTADKYGWYYESYGRSIRSVLADQIKNNQIVL